MNIKDIFKLNIKTFNNALDEINYDKLNILFDMLKDEKCLYFSGVGKNLHISNIISSTFNSLTIRSIPIDPVSAVHGDMGLIENNSKIILISKSGNTDELIYFCDRLKNRNCNSKICLIHSNNKNKLNNIVDYEMYIPIIKECDPWNRVPTTSLVLYLTVLHSIGMAIVNYKNVTVNDFYKNHPGGDIGRNNND